MSASPPSLKARLGIPPAIGVVWMALGSPSMAEIAAAAGADAVVIDAQHGLWDRVSLEAAVGMVRPCPVLVRTADGSPTEIARALDAGATGVIVPLVETVAQAAEAAEAARFPPRGGRSGGGVRPLAGDFARYCADANDRTIVGVMIETVRGVANADAIARTPGFDFVFIGTGDLALSIGCFPQIDARHAQACAAVLAACRAARMPCGIFTLDAAGAVARAREGYDLVVVANDIAVVAGGFRAAAAQFNDGIAPSRKEPSMAASLLTDLAGALLAGDIEVVDLTQTLSPATPVIQLPPPMAPSSAFSSERISHYDEGGPAWYWNNITMGEHTGTQFDAPVHWITGRNYIDGFTDTLPARRFVAPACVIDCSQEVAADPGFVLEPAHVEAWEAIHGRIPGRQLGADEDRLVEAHGPGRLPQHDGDRAGLARPERGHDAAPGGARHQRVGRRDGRHRCRARVRLRPALPAHNLMHGAKKLGLASLTGLDRLPPTGAILVAAPLKIEGGSGSPLRVLALVGAGG